MQVYLPHTTLSAWTEAWAMAYCPMARAIPLSLDNEAYAHWFKEVWEMGKPFMVVEQDVVPWPGAVEELAQCSEPWCAMSYYTYKDFSKPTLGCAKFIPDGDVPMDTAPPDIHAAFVDHLPHWQALDMVVAASLRVRGIEVHQHHPAVAHLKSNRAPIASVGFMGTLAKA